MAETSEMDWAKLDLQRFETVAHTQMAALQAQADYATKMVDVAQKYIAVERDKTRLKILRDAFRNFKMERDLAIRELKQAKDAAGRCEGHLRQLRRVCLGEAAGQETVVFIWSAFYFFLPKFQPPANLAPPPDTLADSNFTRPVGMRPETSSPASYMLQLRAKNCLPKIDSPAMRYVLAIMWAMSEEAAKLQAQYEDRLDEARLRLSKMEEMDWQQLFGGESGSENNQ